jgi:uncharacterized protein YqeY
MLIDKLKKDRMIARKSKNTYSTSMLTTLLGDLETKAKSSGKEMTDEGAIALMKSFVKKNTQAIEKMGVSEKANELRNDNDFWNEYLPSVMSEDRLREIITTLVNDGESIGGVMKHLKINFPDQYDGGLASKIFRDIS